MSCTSRAARRGATLTTLALAALSVAALPAAADPPAGAGEEPPGNRGTVKIHDAATPDDDRREEPHVCEFRIVGFGFPADADLLVAIEGHGGPNAGSGSFTADLGSGAVDVEGDFALAGPALPDGTYRLTVENRTAPGGAKQKVFHVDCPDPVGAVEGTTTTTEVPGTTTTSSTTTSSTSTSTTSTSTTLPGGSIDGTATPGDARDEVVESASGTRATATEVLGTQQVSGQSSRRAQALALTGGDVAVLVAAGLVLVLLGGELVRRRRAGVA
jgi:hypothetical protein